MNLIDVIEQQHLIMQLQEKLILQLVDELAQHTAVDEAQQQFQKIKELERKLYSNAL